MATNRKPVSKLRIKKAVKQVNNKNDIALALGKVLEKAGWDVWDNQYEEIECSCGNLIDYTFTFCPECGAKANKMNIDNETRNLLYKAYLAAKKVDNND